MYIKCLLILVLCFSNACLQNLEKQRANDIPTQRIIGGNVVSPHSIPYQVYLRFIGDNTEWSCGGSLITRNDVLTAGRCGYGASSVEVLLGAHVISDKEATQVKLETKNITIHPNFKMDVDIFVYEDDIALIHLVSPVILNEVINTIKLPSSENTYVNQTGKVSGWGLTDGFNDTSYTFVLQSQENTIISNEMCSLVYYDLKEYDICMKANDTASPCVGDYGSPLVVDDVQVGIVSQGVMFCIPGYPFIYTRVSSFLKWIKENTDYEDNGDGTPINPTTDESTISTEVSSPSTLTSTRLTNPTLSTTAITISTTPSSGNIATQNIEVCILMALSLIWIVE